MSGNDKDNIRELAGQYAENLKDTLQTIREYLTAHKEELEELGRAQKEIERLLPFLAAELKTAQAQGEAPADMLPEDLLAYMTPSGVPLDSPYKAIISAAIAAGKYMPSRVKAIPVTSLDYPLDKPNKEIWRLLTESTGNGQLKINTSTRGEIKAATVLYGINFDALEDIRISRQLTPYDKRAFIACNALLNAGNKLFTLTQIYYAMGNSGRPKAGDLEKINNSLTKMGAARIYIDNFGESEVMTGYPRFKYDGLLFPFERVTAYVNGKVTESAIKILCKPGEELPLVSFARMRRQITTISKELLESPISKTDANLLIDDYLIERIGHMKKDKTLSHKILYSTIFENCDIRTAMQRQRAPEKVKKYLDHYKTCKGGIVDYHEEQDGVLIIL